MQEWMDEEQAAYITSLNSPHCGLATTARPCSLSLPNTEPHHPLMDHIFANHPPRKTRYPPLQSVKQPSKRLSIPLSRRNFSEQDFKILRYSHGLRVLSSQTIIENPQRLPYQRLSFS